MRKMNNKGFAVTGILYTLLVLFLALMLGLITVFSNRKNILNKLKEDVVNNVYLNTVYSYDYDATIPYYEFKAPTDGTYKIELWGAQGGTLCSDNGSQGSYSKGDIKLNKNETIYIYIGEQGSTTNRGQTSYNGGGIGYPSNYSTSYAATGAFSGGGATDVRYFNNDTPSSDDLVWNSERGLNSRIMVAAGGGGRATQGSSYSCNNPSSEGRVGGGLTSVVGNQFTASSQTSGGGCTNTNCGLGDFGIGGNSKQTNHSSGGGGGGYYGGSADQGYWKDDITNGLTGGAGGSSFISGHTGCVAITSETDRTPKDNCTDGTIDNNCSIHYSGYKFTNTIMIDGAGYNWTTEKGSEVVGMPTHDGTSTMTGNSGNGYAKITLIEID